MICSVRTQRVIPGGNVSDLAFAPDSLRLAFFGLGEDGPGIYLADLKSNAVRMLAPRIGFAAWPGAQTAIRSP